MYDGDLRSGYSLAVLVIKLNKRCQSLKLGPCVCYFIPHWGLVFTPPPDGRGVCKSPTTQWCGALLLS